MGCVSSKSHGGGTRNSLTEYQLSVTGVVTPDIEQATKATDKDPQSDTPQAVGLPLIDPPQSDTDSGHNGQAAGSSATPTHSLWDRENPDQQGLVLQSDQYRDVLRHKLTDLVQSVEVKPMLPMLRQLQVIDADRQEDMELLATRKVMVMRLVDHVEKGPLWRLHGFIRSLAVTDQEFLIDVLGLERADYVDPPTPLPSPSISPQGLNATPQGQHKQHFYRCAESDERREFPVGPLPGILQHCERSKRMLMKTTLFGFEDNTPLDLTPIYIKQNPDCKVNQRDVQSTAPDKLFMKLFQSHSPNSILLEGDAGTGKSTTLRQYAYTYCKDLIECHKKGPESPCEGHTWALVAYIPAGSITGSQEDAIRENLLCDERLKDSVISMIKEDGNGVLIINDAIDELRKETEKESLRQYTISHQKDGSPKILVSSRVGICPIEGKFFDRHLLMKGFSLDQGVQYIQNYLRINHGLTEHPVVDHISGNKKDFEWVLMNPLRIHILSEVTARGVITLEDVKSLTTVKLLKVLEDYVVRRDAKFCESDKTTNHSKEFHRLCLESLLTYRHSIRDSAIPSTSPYLAFLTKDTELDQHANEDNFYVFSHEMLLEFMAMQGFIECMKTDTVYKKAVMLLMCSNSHLRNVLQLTCAYISEYEKEALASELIFLLQACLVLQTESVRCDKNRLTKKLLKLPALVKETVSRDILSSGLTSKQIKIVNGTSKQIQKAFNNDAKSLRLTGWFSNGFNKRWYYPQSAFHEFIAGCLRQCPPSLQETISRQTIQRLLPCTRYNLVRHQSDGTQANYDQFVFTAANGRWGEVKKTFGKSCEKNVSVFMWCPLDIVQTLTEFYRHQEPVKGVHHVSIELNSSAELWGVQPPELLTCDQWVPAIHEVLSHNANSITIYTNEASVTTPLGGLLNALQLVIKPEHGLTGGIDVWYGQVGEEQLGECYEWTCREKLDVHLWSTTVLLSAEQDEDYVRRLHERVQDMVATPTYITPGGRTINIPQQETACDLPIDL